MKLRNKKTGEIWNIGKVLTNDYPSYGTLEQITEDFEDYNPPLIKDEKIRKAVRAWAECCCVKVVNHFICDDCSCFMFTDEKGNDCSLDFTYRADNLESNADYTIAELCGELQDDADM